MAFNSIFTFTVLPHETGVVAVTFPGIQGAQFLMPQVANFDVAQDVKVVFFNQGKRIDASGNTTYFADYRNDSDVTAMFHLQGGGFPNSGFNDELPEVTISPGGVHLDRREVPDLGAQFIGADVKTSDCRVDVFDLGKTLLPGNRASYSYGFRNRGSIPAVCRRQGGGIAVEGFNNAGSIITLAAPSFSTGPESVDVEITFSRTDTFFADVGPRYFMADVKTENSKVVCTEIGKISFAEGPSPPHIAIKYVARFRNDGPFLAEFKIQGGGFP